MVWGSFSIVHIITLICAVGLNITLYFGVKKLPSKWQTIVLFIFSLTGIAAIIFNLVKWNSPIEYLPFHLCSLNALVLPIVTLTKNKTLGNLLLLWSLGAVCALVVNMAQADYELLSWTFVFYYFPHVFEVGLPIILLLLGYYKKDFRFIASTIGITLIVYTLIHFINVGINIYTVNNNIVDWKGDIIVVNYMYSIHPENPLLDLFNKIIPYSYWYMLLCVPVIFIYLGLLYLPQIINEIKTNKENKLKLNLA